MGEREQALAWCVQVHEDVAKKLDETWPNDPLLRRCERAFGWFVKEIERLEEIAYPLSAPAPASASPTIPEANDRAAEDTAAKLLVAHKPGTCPQCGRYLDRRGKCRFPEHNA